MTTEPQPAPEHANLTIRDVAKAAGVSPATVSRALRGMGNVDPATRARIEGVAHELNYTVSPAASRLARGRTGTIGIITPWIGRWYFAELFAGIDEALAPHDVDLLLHKTEQFELPQGPKAHVRMRRRVDGVVVIGLAPEGDDLAGLNALGVPVVLLGARSAGLASVSIDDRAGAHAAVAHLVTSGHRCIGLITGRTVPTTILPETDRLRGYLDALEAHGIEAPDELRAVGDFTSLGGARAMTELLARRPRPTAVFCMSDEMAYGAMGVLARAGVPVGGDPQAGEIAIIGFDGHDLAEPFGLSTVEQPVRDLGRKAARQLMSQIDGVSATQAITVRTVLRLRRTTGDG